MSEKSILVRYSMYLDPMKTPEEKLIKASRIALAELFSGFAYALLRDEGVEKIDLRKDHILELSSETEHWDTKLILRLIKVDNEQ